MLALYKAVESSRWDSDGPKRLRCAQLRAPILARASPAWGTVTWNDLGWQMDMAQMVLADLLCTGQCAKPLMFTICEPCGIPIFTGKLRCRQAGMAWIGEGKAH